MFVEPVHFPWRPLRSNVTADDTILTTFEYDNPTYLANKFDISRANNTDYTTALIAFWGKAADNADALFTIYGRRSDGGFIEVLAGGAAGEEITLGSKLVTKDPILKTTVTGYWVDTIVNTHVWAQADVIHNSAEHVAYLEIPLAGISDIMCQFDLDGGDGTAMTAANAIISGIG